MRFPRGRPRPGGLYLIQAMAGSWPLLRLRVLPAQPDDPGSVPILP